MELGSDNPNAPKSIIQSIRDWYRGLPDKKRYLEFMTALLTIPVLLTVLLSNVSNLQNKKNEPTPTPQPTADQPLTGTATTTPKTTVTPTSTPTPTPGPECIKEIGPIELSDPEEGSTVTGDPVYLDITRTGKNYCSVVWSYRINGSAWSEYTDKSISLYGLTPGVKNLELRVKSIVSTDTQLIKRTFTVAGTSTPTPTATSSAATN